MAKSRQTDWKEERPIYLLLAITGAVIAIVFYFIPKNSRDIDETQLKSINNLVLEKAPEVIKSRHGERVLLHIKGYEKPFQVAGFNFSENVKRNILLNIKSSDTITVKTDISEFNKVDNETFIDGYTEVNSLIKDGQEYLNIQEANKKAKSDLELGVPVGLFLLIAGLIYWSFKTKPRLSPTIVIGVGLLLVVLITKE